MSSLAGPHNTDIPSSMSARVSFFFSFQPIQDDLISVAIEEEKKMAAKGLLFFLFHFSFLGQSSTTDRDVETLFLHFFQEKPKKNKIWWQRNGTTNSHNKKKLFVVVVVVVVALKWRMAARWLKKKEKEKEND